MLSSLVGHGRQPPTCGDAGPSHADPKFLDDRGRLATFDVARRSTEAAWTRGPGDWARLEGDRLPFRVVLVTSTKTVRGLDEGCHVRSQLHQARPKGCLLLAQTRSDPFGDCYPVWVRSGRHDVR